MAIVVSWAEPHRVRAPRHPNYDVIIRQSSVMHASAGPTRGRSASMLANINAHWCPVAVQNHLHHLDVTLVCLREVEGVGIVVIVIRPREIVVLRDVIQRTTRRLTAKPRKQEVLII